jgi:hypothetical protein
LFTEQRVSRIVVDEAHQALVGSFYWPLGRFSLFQ